MQTWLHTGAAFLTAKEETNSIRRPWGAFRKRRRLSCTKLSRKLFVDYCSEGPTPGWEKTPSWV